ncbi:hypothetical protein BEP19_12775 [Ammoniphilus oxalaticus]|uniref:Uncharacterized protein n=1 Tax=Ammoniphilus oxalaticus TaxID=66863 RepID=A0A419SH46_9BACL|nr:hypothetical protein BEP19_12775 [Ammoniphilus oxalaticus]
MAGAKGGRWVWGRVGLRAGARGNHTLLKTAGPPFTKQYCGWAGIGGLLTTMREVLGGKRAVGAADPHKSLGPRAQRSKLPLQMKRVNRLGCKGQSSRYR